MIKLILLVILNVVISQITFAQNISVLGDVVKNSDHQIVLMGQKAAVDYCQSINAHLPSLREIAMHMQSRGAKGIKEMNQFENEFKALQEDYYLMISRDVFTDAVDSFYFNGSGYIGSDEIYSWSSSRPYSYEGPSRAFYLNLSSDIIGRSAFASSSALAVRCIAN